MNFNFDKFWEWLQKWSVGKILVTLSLLAIIFNHSEYPRSLNYFITMGVFLQIFDFCDNDLTNNKDKKDVKIVQAIVLNVFMAISVGVLIWISYKLFYL